MREGRSNAPIARRLTRTELIKNVAHALEIPLGESETIVETIFAALVRAIQAGDRIEIRGFGSFDTRQRKARIGRNPKTGAAVSVPPKRVPYFKVSKDLKELVRQIE